LHVFGPQFFGGSAPEFLESIYKIDTVSDHVAKFRGDRPRELGDYALKKRRKHQEQNRRPPVLLNGRRKKKFEIGDQVLILIPNNTASKVFSRWQGPATVVEIKTIMATSMS